MVGSDRPSRFLATRLERSAAFPSEAQMCGAHPGRAGERIEALGILLNAATDEKGQPGFTYRMSGNCISATTLDLDPPFGEIHVHLDGIVEEYFLGE